MKTLITPLRTERLRIEPITPAIARQAAAGAMDLSEHLDAVAPRDWWSSNLRLLTQGLNAPERAIIIHCDDRRVIGDLRFEPMRGALRTYELGYSIAPEYRRRGLASEASGALLDWLFDEGEAERVIAGCDRRNRASVRTLRKLGFWLDSSRGDAFWWIITADLRREARAKH